MKKTPCLLMLVLAGCPGAVDPGAGQPLDNGGGGFSADAGANGDDLGPVISPPEFDGYWLLKYTVAPRQAFLGVGALNLEVREGRVECVREDPKESCPLDWGRPSLDRPITNDGIVRIEFTMAFPACNYAGLDAFRGENERLIGVSIVGSEIAGTDGLVFDVLVEQRYIFSDQTVLSAGTLEHFPNARTISCGFVSFE